MTSKHAGIISIPIDCKVAANGKCSLVNIQVYDVLYFQSCNLPWVMCRCLQAEMSQSDTRDRFGMIGSKLRSYVRHFMAFPGPVGAWTDNQGEYWSPKFSFHMRSQLIPYRYHNLWFRWKYDYSQWLDPSSHSCHGCWPRKLQWLVEFLFSSMSLLTVVLHSSS